MGFPWDDGTHGTHRNSRIMHTSNCKALSCCNMFSACLNPTLTTVYVAVCHQEVLKWVRSFVDGASFTETLQRPRVMFIAARKDKPLAEAENTFSIITDGESGALLFEIFLRVVRSSYCRAHCSTPCATGRLSNQKTTLLMSVF